MMSMRDEQAANTTIPGEPVPYGTRECDPRDRFQQHNRYRLGFAFSLMVISILLALGGFGLLIFAGIALLLLPVFLFIAAVSLLVFVGCYLAFTHVQSEMRRFQVGEHPQVIVKNDVGSIHIRVGGDGEVLTHATRWSRWFEETPANIQLYYKQNAEENSVTVRVDRVGRWRVFRLPHVHLDLTVPRSTDLRVTTNVGDIWITGVSGQLSLHSNTGSLYVRRGLLTGNSELSTNVGSVNFHEAIDPQGTYQFTTGTGSVNVALPAYEAFHLDARANLGSITTAVPGMTITSRTDHEVQGEVGSPPCASMRLTSGIGSVNVYAELDGYVTHWEEYQEVYHRARKTVRGAVFGGLAGGIFFIGLAAAILSGHFWPVFLAALAIGWLMGLLSSPKAQALYVGFQGFVFFLGLAVCSVVGWWPWIVVMLGISAILEIANGLLQLGDKERWWW